MQLGLDLTTAKVSTIGHDQIEIVQVADFFNAPETLVEIAETLTFARINPHYPGIRAEVDPALLGVLCETVSTLAATQLGRPQTEWVGHAWYSIVTQPPAALTPIQRLPHFDGFDESQMAVMIYLHRTAHGGTGFYRQCATGYEIVTEGRYPEYKAALEAGVREHGLPAARYIEDGAPLFERVAAFEAAFNSLILYPGTALHSGVIDNQARLSSDPRAGRLTINGFFRPA